MRLCAYCVSRSMAAFCAPFPCYIIPRWRRPRPPDAPHPNGYMPHQDDKLSWQKRRVACRPASRPVLRGVLRCGVSVPRVARRVVQSLSRLVVLFPVSRCVLASRRACRLIVPFLASPFRTAVRGVCSSRFLIQFLFLPRLVPRPVLACRCLLVSCHAHAFIICGEIELTKTARR